MATSGRQISVDVPERIKTITTLGQSAWLMRPHLDLRLGLFPINLAAVPDSLLLCHINQCIVPFASKPRLEIGALGTMVPGQSKNGVNVFAISSSIATITSTEAAKEIDLTPCPMGIAFDTSRLASNPRGSRCSWAAQTKTHDKLC